MKILLTGASGFIGKNLHALYTNTKNEVMTIGREWAGSNTTTKRNEFVRSKIQHYQPDVIIHCAAEIYQDDKMIESNILFTHWLLDTTKDLDYSAFINIGSSSEYGKKEFGMRETDVLEPRTMYEATKGAATLICEAHARMYNKPILTVRPFSVYGLHEPPHRLIPTIIRNLKEGKEIIIAPGTHDFIYIKDFVDGIKLLVTKLMVNKIIKAPVTPDIYNLGSGDCINNLDVYQCISELMNLSGRLVLSPEKMRVFDTMMWRADMTKTRTVLGYRPAFSFKDGIADLLTLMP